MTFLDVLATFQDAPATYAFVILLGLVFGSFANVCIYRWPPSDEFPDGRSVVKPPSHCFVCKTPIPWYDNVPLLAFLWLRGRCRFCKTEFSPRYLLVEAMTGMLFGAAWWFAMHSLYDGSFGMHLLRFVADAGFVFVLVVTTFIDIDHKLILNKLMVPSLVIFYGFGVALDPHHWYIGLIGATVGFGLPWTVGEIYYRVTGRDGLGTGDAVLLAVIGALLGWKGVIVSLFGGSMVGTVVTLVSLLFRARDRDPLPADAPVEQTGDAEPAPPPPSLLKSELPFGPYLSIAALVCLFAGDWIELKFRMLGQ